ncbi:bifunctional phosphopantothenoylcysteine decarboxylase/phosphopantothenate--cysteine ligase CoaBC [Halobaculum sp. MBLA0143]|uniref:bifunctional phosphopantothenoylcysteine decarboxylase/phosphopantothenate--cysteine ligase CoaBC n=1 Tax=Halobaculum sp. MBLA0143 TaxID=3079933 RepID=UPI003526A772
MLDGVNVALGVTGSIAAVKTVELAHELRRHGAAVRAVTTDSAEGILHPWALEFATERPVVREITGAVEHVELCGRDGWADVLLIAPATANTVGKIAGAVDDTPVTTCATTALGAGVETVVVPAMHEPMYDHPGVLDALDRLESWGVRFVDPRIEEGKAKIAAASAVVTEVARAAGDRPLSGRHVVVTAGATSEAVDPVRVLTSRASGKTGRAVARACRAAGAEVTLVHDGDDVPWADCRRVESAAEMLAAVRDAVGGDAGDGNDTGESSDAGDGNDTGESEPAADALVSAAAISDYTVAAADQKIRSGRESLTLELEPTPKLIDEVAADHPELTVVGFKAETEGDDDAMVARARETMRRAGLAFVVANDASVMGDDETRALVVREPGAAEPVAEFTGTKARLGTRVAAELAREL